MTMAKAWHILFCTVLMLLVCPVTEADVTLLETNPPGTYISIQGPVSIAGTAPLSIASLPVGEYELTADGPGLPALRGRFARSADGLLSRPWSGPSALIKPPGFVHLERGEKRGFLFALAGGGGAVMSVIKSVELTDAEEKWDRAVQTYLQAVSEEDIQAAQLNREAMYRRTQDEKEMRNLWLAYLGVSWLGSSIENLLLTPQPELSYADSGLYVANLPSAGGPSAAFCSLLFPGAGQRYMGKYKRGNFFLAATATLTACALVAHDEFLDSKRDQAEAQQRFDMAETEVEQDLARRRLLDADDETDDASAWQWAFACAAGGVYLWNILDAFGLGDEIAVPGLTLSVEPDSDGANLSATWRLP
jgi:hypothetical protein